MKCTCSELALRSADFHAPGNVNFPALLIHSLSDARNLFLMQLWKIILQLLPSPNSKSRPISSKNWFWGVNILSLLPPLHSNATFAQIKMGRDGTWINYQQVSYQCTGNYWIIFKLSLIDSFLFYIGKPFPMIDQFRVLERNEWQELGILLWTGKQKIWQKRES